MAVIIVAALAIGVIGVMLVVRRRRRTRNSRAVVEKFVHQSSQADESLQDGNEDHGAVGSTEVHDSRPTGNASAVTALPTEIADDTATERGDDVESVASMTSVPTSAPPPYSRSQMSSRAPTYAPASATPPLERQRTHVRDSAPRERANRKS